ncbi:MAG: molybdopterin molybdotransferase MoeA [Fimbriimonadales bacterium]
MLTYEEACEAIAGALPTAGAEIVAEGDFAGRALAEPVYAIRPVPPFTNSAVDGYAVGNEEDVEPGRVLSVCGVSAAGDAPPPNIPRGAALRVFTGSPLPENVYGVAMQEDVAITGDGAILGERVSTGHHVRRLGADFGTGELLLSPSVTLGPGNLALLASQGIVEARVFTRVRVTILTTGDELVPPSVKPNPWQLHDSNTLMLESQVRSAGAVIVGAMTEIDDRGAILDRIRAASEISDIVLISGGASVGEHDHVASAAAELGQVILHGVSVKPGKPFLAGKVGNAILFGLPGNPASAFVCFEILVREAIGRLAGHGRSALRWVPVGYLDSHIECDRDEFVRCQSRLESGRLVARRVHEQGSFGLRSLGAADVLVRVPANVDHAAGDARLGLLIG